MNPSERFKRERNGQFNNQRSPRDDVHFYDRNGHPRDFHDDRSGCHGRFHPSDDREYAASEFGGRPQRDEHRQHARNNSFFDGRRDGDRRRPQNFSSRAHSVADDREIDRDDDLSRRVPPPPRNGGYNGPPRDDRFQHSGQHPLDRVPPHGGGAHRGPQGFPRNAQRGDRGGDVGRFGRSNDFGGAAPHQRPNQSGRPFDRGRPADRHGPPPGGRRPPRARSPFRSDISTVESIYPHSEYYKEPILPDGVDIPIDDPVPSMRGGEPSVAPSARSHRPLRSDGRPGEPSILPDMASPRSNMESQIRREKEWNREKEWGAHRPQAPERDRNPPSQRGGSHHSHSRHSSRPASKHSDRGRRQSIASSDSERNHRPSTSTRRSEKSDKSRDRDRKKHDKRRGGEKKKRRHRDSYDEESDSEDERPKSSKTGRRRKDRERDRDSDRESGSESDSSTESRRHRRKHKHRDRKKERERHRERERDHKKEREREPKKKDQKQRRFKKGDFAPDAAPCLSYFDGGHVRVSICCLSVGVNLKLSWLVFQVLVGQNFASYCSA